MKMIDCYSPRVYKIVNLQNKKCYYGSTITSLHSRCLDHMEDLKRRNHRNNYLQKAWNKYGEDFFDFVVLEEMPNNTEYEIRNREQWYLDNCVRWHIDYNLSRSAFTNRHFASEKEIKEGKWDITWEQFEQITFLLQNTNDLCVTIAKQTGVKIPLVQRIYERRSYSKLTGEMTFLPRRVGMSEHILKEEQIDLIFEKYNNGIDPIKIAEELETTQNAILNVLAKRTWKSYSDAKGLKRNYKKRSKCGGILQFSLLKEFIAFYPDGLGHFSEDKLEQSYIRSCCNKIDKNVPRKVSYNNFLWCYKGEEENLPSYAEILIDGCITGKKYSKSIIIYDENGVVDYCRNVKKITNGNKQRIKEIYDACVSGDVVDGFRYKYLLDAPEVDIIQLIKKKYCIL